MPSSFTHRKLSFTLKSGLGEIFDLHIFRKHKRFPVIKNKALQYGSPLELPLEKHRPLGVIQSETISQVHLPRPESKSNGLDERFAVTSDQDKNSNFPLDLFLNSKEANWHQALGQLKGANKDHGEHLAAKNDFHSESEKEEKSATLKSLKYPQEVPDDTNQTPDFNREELQFLTQALLEQLKQQLGEQKFKLYFDHTLSISHLSSRSIIFNVNTIFLKNLIEQTLQDHFVESIKAILGKGIPFSVITANNVDHSVAPLSLRNSFENIESDSIGQSLGKEYSVHRAASVGKVSFSINDYSTNRDAGLSEKELLETTISQQSQELEGSKITIDSKKNFDNFIVGPSNNLAHASALAVAKGPGHVYQALYLYGNSGLGKTHLLHSIANYIIQHHRGMRIYLTTATEFMSEMINAIQEKTIHQFRKKYYELIDILIIDDIHELKNREGTQNEFFHIFNQLQKRKKQLIFTSDKEPREINGIEERIKTRLSSALVVEIQQPDLETRIAILKRKSNDKDIHLSDDVINLIASNVRSNIRELEGSLIKLGAYSSIFKVDIDLQTAKEQLKIADEIPTSQISVETVVKVVSQFFKIPIPDIRSKSRSKEIAQARHIAMYLSYYLAKATLNEIGNYFSKRDHTSVIHAVNKVKALQKSDQTTGQLLYEIEKRLQS